jgi:hypothetical protein
MATLKLVQNGRKRKTTRKRRRNTTAVTKTVANKRRRKRNGASSASVKSFATRNGLKLVKRTAANGRKRHKRRSKRNGTIMQRSNGLLGNSKETIISVASLLIGLGVTKVESSILTPMAQNLLGNLGLGNFAKPLIEAGLAVTVNKWAAEAVKKGSGKYVMYGGLAMALMDVVEAFLPQTSAYNPFASANNTPVVINQPNIVNPNALRAGQATTGTLIRPRVPMGYKRPMFGGGY